MSQTLAYIQARDIQSTKVRYPSTTKSRWEEMTREQYGLSPVQLGTLVAMIAYEDATGEPMPISVMREASPRLTGHYAISYCDGPSELYRLGLAERIGPQTARAYRATKRGRRRAAE